MVRDMRDVEETIEIRWPRQEVAHRDDKIDHRSIDQVTQKKDRKISDGWMDEWMDVTIWKEKKEREK